MKKELFEYCYNNKISLNRLSKWLSSIDIKISSGSLIKRSGLLGCNTFTISEASNTELTKNQKEKTNLKKFGYKNPSQCEQIKLKKENKALSKYSLIFY